MQTGDLIACRRSWWWYRGRYPVRKEWRDSMASDRFDDNAMPTYIAKTGIATRYGKKLFKSVPPGSFIQNLPNTPPAPVLGNPSQGFISAPYIPPIIIPREESTMSQMPQDVPILVIHMEHLDVKRDPALVVFYHEGIIYWVRAANWEHVHHGGLEVISPFHEAT